MTIRYLLPVLALLLAVPAQAQRASIQPQAELIIDEPDDLAVTINNSTFEYPAPYVLPDTSASNVIGRGVFTAVTAEGDTLDLGPVLTLEGVTAPFGLAVTSTGAPALGCVDDTGVASDIANDLTGQIAFVQRGVCSFVFKVQNAAAAGAAAIIIYNDPPRDPDVVTNLGAPAGFTEMLTITSGWLPYVMAEPIVNALAKGFEVSGTFHAEPGTVAIEDTPEAAELAFGAPSPNPFSATTSFRMSLPEAEEITIEVFNVNGRRVATLHEGVMRAGETAVEFDASGLPAGVYLVRATGEQFSLARPVTVVR